MREVDRLDLGSVFNLHYASNPTVMQISGPHYTPRPPSHPFQDMVSVSTPLGAEAGLGSGRCWPCAGRLAGSVGRLRSARWGEGVAARHGEAVPPLALCVGLTWRCPACAGLKGRPRQPTCHSVAGEGGGDPLRRLAFGRPVSRA